LAWVSGVFSVKIKLREGIGALYGMGFARHAFYRKGIEISERKRTC